MSSRSMTMIIWNHTAYTLTKFVGTATAGTVPGPNKTSPPASGATVTISVAPGKSLSVYAGNSNGACNGTFTVSDSGNNVMFPVTYVHPSSNDPTTVHVVPNSGFPACMSVNDQAMPLKGHDPVVNIGLYVGDAVYEWPNGGAQQTAGYAAPLSSAPYTDNNARDVVNSMFQTDIRTATVVSLMLDQYNAVPYQPADYSGAQLSLIAPNRALGSANPKGQLTQTILNLWPGVVASPTTSSPDYAFVQFLANFVVPSPAASGTPPLVMWIPKFIYNGNATSGDTSGPAYELLGYQSYPLAGTGGSRFNLDNVKLFLQLLMGGAHFVNIQADRDFANFTPSTNVGRNLYTAFTNAFPDNNTMSGRHSCVGNSHYTNTINTSGWYYGNQMGEWAASGCGLLLSLLVAKTADNQYDTFMQLEGWPADNDWVFGDGSIEGGARHGGDYAAYKKTFWNISTYGATPYSEKRATTIFLAPAPWTPTINSTTYMMTYVGAETKQGWLQTAFVSVPAGTAPLS